ncbi:hypothetical protein J6590_020102 [Homalodisca vitripennis]|nr:hypothetical protein J6590_020102 [Homalodisca vitripennis]
MKPLKKNKKLQDEGAALVWLDCVLSQEQKEAAREMARMPMRNRRVNLRGQKIIITDNFQRARRDYSSIVFNRAAFRYDLTTALMLPFACFEVPPSLLPLNPGLCCLLQHRSQSAKE